MNEISSVTIAVLCCLVVYQWLRIRSLSADQDKDYRYFQWWMASIEERKADKPDLSSADYDDEPWQDDR